MLGSRGHWQADILSAFQRHRLPGCALNDIKMFLRNLTEKFTTHFQILELPYSSDLAPQIIRERDGALKSACTRPGVQNNWFNRFTAAKLEAKSRGVHVHTDLPIYLQMLDHTLFEEAVPFLGDARSSVSAISVPPHGERNNRGSISGRPHERETIRPSRHQDRQLSQTRN